MIYTETWLDKSAWGDGPWQHEPDRIEWRAGDAPLPCLMLRHPRFGHWCAYVGVPPSHPLHGCTDVPDIISDHAHGGVTFTGSCMEDERPQRERVCHVAQPGEADDVWWFGFDHCHGLDLAPGMAAMCAPNELGGQYRDVEYVQTRLYAMALVLDTP